MSTKIYNGYIIRKPLLEFYPELPPFGEKIRQKTKDIIAKTIAWSAAFHFDNATLGIPLPASFGRFYFDGKISIIWALECSIWDAHRKAQFEGVRDVFDFQCDICLIPAKDKTYAMLFSGNRAFDEIWE